MNRRELLKVGVGGGGVAGVGGIGWRMTQDDLTVGVRNTTADSRPVTIEVDSDGGTVYTDSFDVAANQTVERPDVTGPGKYTLRITLDDREDRAFEFSADTQLCHESRAIFEIGMGDALAMFFDCEQI